MLLFGSLLVGIVLRIAVSVRDNRFYPKRLAAFLVLGLLVGGVLSGLRVIPAGHVGVIDLFGQVSEQSLSPGLKIVNPLATVIPISVRTQEDKEVADVPSREGLTVQLEISLLYRLDPM